MYKLYSYHFFKIVLPHLSSTILRIRADPCSMTLTNVTSLFGGAASVAGSCAPAALVRITQMSSPGCDHHLGVDHHSGVDHPPGVITQASSPGSYHPCVARLPIAIYISWIFIHVIDLC